VAHVLVADDFGTISELLRQVLEAEGHRVTAVRDGWGMLAALRASLHPVVAIFCHHLMWQPLHDSRIPQPVQDYVWQACARNLDDLRAHRFLDLSPSDRAPGPPVQTLYEQLGIVTLHMPFDIDGLLAVFGELAQEPA
jgi:CheY-like chemotaxis protein